MPIDPAIPLAAQGIPQLANPMAVYAQAQQGQLQRAQTAALQEERLASAQNRLALAAKTQRENAAHQAFVNAIQQGRGVEAASREWASTNAPDALPLLDDYYTKVAENKAHIQDLQNKVQTETNNLHNAYMDRVGHTADLALKYGGNDPVKLQQAIALGAAHYAEDFATPEDRQQAQQMYQQLSALPPDQLQATLEQLRAKAPYFQTQQAALAKPEKLAQGESLVIPATGQVVASNAPKVNLEAKDVMLDGKRASVTFNPLTGKYSNAAGEDVSARVSPIPPASLIINDQRNAGLNLPAWALDDSRPSGPEGNQLDPTIKKTPNGLYQDAINFINSGQYPPTGRGNDATAIAQRAAIDSKVGAIAAKAGVDVSTLRATFRANAGSLNATQKSSDAVQAFMSTADKNAALLETSLKKMPDTGSPLLNKPLRAFETSVVGDPNMAPIATYLRSVTNEYAKIVSQPNLSGVLSDSARKETEVLLNPNATVQQMIGSLRALNAEGNNRLTSLGDQIQRIQSRMQGPTAPTNAPTATTESAEHRVWRLTGKLGQEPK